MIFIPSFNATSITTLVDHPRTCQHPRIRSLGHRPSSYRLNSTPEIIGPTLMIIFFLILMWGPIISKILFRLNGLGLWPNDLIRGRRYIQGRSIKVEVEMTLREELKGIYDRPKPIRGEKSPRNIYPRWFETFLSS